MEQQINAAVDALLKRVGQHGQILGVMTDPSTLTVTVLGTGIAPPVPLPAELAGYQVVWHEATPEPED